MTELQPWLLKPVNICQKCVKVPVLHTYNRISCLTCMNTHLVCTLYTDGSKSQNGVGFKGGVWKQPRNSPTQNPTNISHYLHVELQAINSAMSIIETSSNQKC